MVFQLHSACNEAVVGFFEVASYPLVVTSHQQKYLGTIFLTSKSKNVLENWKSVPHQCAVGEPLLDVARCAQFLV